MYFDIPRGSIGGAYRHAYTKSQFFLLVGLYILFGKYLHSHHPGWGRQRRGDVPVRFADAVTRPQVTCPE